MTVEAMLLVIRRARHLAALRVKDCDNGIGKASMVAVYFIALHAHQLHGMGKGSRRLPVSRLTRRLQA